MEHIFDQIRGTLDAGFPYAAIMLALAVPDICANLSIGPEASTSNQGKRYKQWYRDHVVPVYSLLTDDDAWSLRCGVVHQGAFGNRQKQFDRAIFCSGSSVLNIVLNDSEIAGIKYDRVLIADAGTFCEAMIKAASDWFSRARETPVVAANLPRLVGTYKDGIAPLVVGMTCVG
ncbi:hypothetical protein [Parapedomonas caeni]